MKTIIVDDSALFRRAVSEAVKNIEGVEVIATANDGDIALQKLKNAPDVDLMIVDIEMPGKNGYETVKELRGVGYKGRIIIFASETASSQTLTLKSLNAGADDFVAKPKGNQTNFQVAIDLIESQLRPRIEAFFEKPVKKAAVEKKAAPPKSIFDKVNVEAFTPSIIVIASSTGGPMALEVFFSKMKKPPGVPVLVVQHMPPKFTASLADRLTQETGVPFKEAFHGEKLEAGKVYIAPGGYHMTLKKNDDGKYLDVSDEMPPVCSVRPAADPMFESVVKIYKGSVLGFVLTGMGEDGKNGSIEIKNAGGAVVTQSEKSCVVYGMPRAVDEIGASDLSLDLEKCGELFDQKI